MANPDDQHRFATPEGAWRSESGDLPNPRMKLTPDALRALARSRERLNTRVATGVVSVAIILCGALLFNVYRLDQPWIRLGQAWALAVLVYLLGVASDRGSSRAGISETCAQFLQRQHAERRLGYLRIRDRLFLFVPAIFASWWGGGPLAAAKGLKLDPSSWLYHFYAGPWLFPVAGTALVLAWLGFSKAAGKALRDLEELRRGIG